MGRLVQQPPPARTDRQLASRRGGSALLCPGRGTGLGRLTQAKPPQETRYGSEPGVSPAERSPRVAPPVVERREEPSQPRPVGHLGEGRKRAISASMGRFSSPATTRPAKVAAWACTRGGSALSGPSTPLNEGSTLSRFSLRTA